MIERLHSMGHVRFHLKTKSVIEIGNYCLLWVYKIYNFPELSRPEFWSRKQLQKRIRGLLSFGVKEIWKIVYYSFEKKKWKYHRMWMQLLLESRQKAVRRNSYGKVNCWTSYSIFLQSKCFRISDLFKNLWFLSFLILYFFYLNLTLKKNGCSTFYHLLRRSKSQQKGIQLITIEQTLIFSTIPNLFRRQVSLTKLLSVFSTYSRAILVSRMRLHCIFIPNLRNLTKKKNFSGDEERSAAFPVKRLSRRFGPVSGGGIPFQLCGVSQFVKMGEGGK